MVLVAVVGAACSSGSPSRSSGISPEEAARAQRRIERREAHDREEERAEREARKLQEELAAVPTDLALGDAVLGIDEVPPDLPVGATAEGEAFLQALAERPAAEPPVVCPGQRTTTPQYSSLPAEDVAGLVVVTPNGEASLNHVVTRFDEVARVWTEFQSIVNLCVSTFNDTPEGTEGITLERFTPFRYGRTVGMGYRQVVALPGSPSTLYARYLMRNGRCLSDVTIAAQPLEPGQYAPTGFELQAAAERLNRVAGCEITSED